MPSVLHEYPDQQCCICKDSKQAATTCYALLRSSAEGAQQLHSMSCEIVPQQLLQYITMRLPLSIFCRCCQQPTLHFARLQLLIWLAVMQALLSGASKDPSTPVRQAARAALAKLPLTAMSLTPLLTVSDEAAPAGEADLPAPKTRRRSKAESSIKQAAQGLHILELAGLMPLHGLCLCIQLCLYDLFGSLNSSCMLS